MDLQFDQQRSGKRHMSEGQRQYPPPGRRLDPVEYPVIFAQMCGARPAADDLGRVIEAAQQSLSST